MTQRYTLSLAHINDTHSNFEPSRVHFSLNLGLKSLDITSHSGGYARLGYQISQARDQATRSNTPFLFLHGGDSFQGTLYFSHFKGKANAHLLNLLAPDAMVIGNHDIDEGNARLAEFAKQIDFPLLAGNMDLSQEDIRKPGNLRTVANILAYDEKTQLSSYLEKPFYDKKLAVIGITLDQMKDIARPDPDTHFVDAIATTARTVSHLHAKGIKHIIVLSHLGLDQDKRLAEQVDGISLIVGGHTHTLQGDFSALGLSNIPYGETINGTPIVHAGKYAETLGLAEVEFDEAGRAISLSGGNYFMLDKQFMLSSSEQVDDTDYQAVRQRFDEHPYILWDEADEDIHGVIHDIYRPAIAEMENKVLALVPKNLVHTRLPSKALPHGSEIAPWVSRSMFQEAKLEDPRIHFALHNAGGVRQSVAQGQLTLVFQSFAFKRGIPMDADYVFDVRMLPNPHYESNLKNLTGIDKPVVDFFENYKEVDKMFHDINNFINEWLNAFKTDQRHSLNIAIGCTGGKHRSVYIANKLFTNFSNPKSQVIIRHRDINH